MNELDKETVEFFKQAVQNTACCKVVKVQVTGYMAVAGDTEELLSQEYANWKNALNEKLDNIKISEKVKVKNAAGELEERDGPSFFSEREFIELADLGTDASSEETT